MGSAWIDDYLDAFSRHDSSALVGFMTEDCHYVDQALGQSATGHAEIKKFIDDFEQTMSTNYRFEKGYALVTDTGYAVEWTVSGINDRANPAFTATGKP